MNTKAWWQKTDGSGAITDSSTKEVGQTDWESTKRQLDWDSVVRPEKRGVGDETEEQGVAEVDGSSLDLPSGEKGMVVSTCSSTRPGPKPRRSPLGELCPTSESAFHIREHGNPAIPGHPDDLKNCDITATDGKLLGSMSANGDWTEPSWDENVPPSDPSGLNTRQKNVDKWWEEKAPKSIRPRIHPFLKNSLCANPDGQGGEDTLRKELGVCPKKGIVNKRWALVGA